MMTEPTPHPIRNHIIVYVFFLALAILITWPLLTVLSTSFAGYPFGDAHEMTRHIWWFKYALQHGQPLIFQPLLGYPDGIQGVILWSDPLQFFPGWLLAFVMPLPAAYNLQCLLNLALNGWAAYFLMWKLLEASRYQSYVKHAEKFTEFHSLLGLTPSSRFAALLAGVVFMTAPVMQGHVAGGHGGLLVQWPLPLLAWALFQLRSEADAETRTRYIVSLRKTIFPAVLFFVLLPFGHTLQLIYAGMPLIGVFGLTLLIKRDWRALGRLVLVVALGSIILLLFLIPVFQSTLGTSAYTDEGGGVAFSMDLLGIVTPSFNHPLYGNLDYTHHVLGVNIVEGSSYVGIIAGLLALVALWKNRAARWWLLLAVVAWVLALGPLLKIFDTPVSLRTGEYSTFITLPWSLVADLPGFNLARTPGRFGFVIALAVAVMVGYGAAWVEQWVRKSSYFVGTRYIVSPRVASAIVVGALVVLDYQSFWPLPTYSAEIPQAVHDLAARDDVRAVFDVPWENVLAAKDALWLQTAHEKPLIAGQVTRKTPVSPAKLTILEQTFNPALLNEADADVVIIHKQYDTDGKLAENARKKLGDPFYEDGQLALFNVPETAIPPAWFIYLPPPIDRSTTAAFTIHVTDSDSGYLYSPKMGWADLSGWIYAPAGGGVQLSFDGQQIHEWNLAGETFFNLPLPITEPGYHTVTFKAIHPCPQSHDSLLRCKILWISNPNTNGLDSTEYSDRTTKFVPGLTLIGTGVSSVGIYGTGELRINLWWSFDQPRTEQDIRFIKILDKDGNQVVGIDETLGIHAANSQWVETLDIPLTDVPDGAYRVCVGWYNYPDLTRFAVLSDVDGAQDGLACIGKFTVPAS